MNNPWTILYIILIIVYFISAFLIARVIINSKRSKRYQLSELENFDDHKTAEQYYTGLVQIKDNLKNIQFEKRTTGTRALIRKANVEIDELNESINEFNATDAKYRAISDEQIITLYNDSKVKLDKYYTEMLERCTVTCPSNKELILQFIKQFQMFNESTLKLSTGEREVLVKSTFKELNIIFEPFNCSFDKNMLNLLINNLHIKQQMKSRNLINNEEFNA